MARRIGVSYETDANETLVRWSTEDGQVAEFKLDELPEDIRREVAVYGLQHLLRDRTSAISDPNEKLGEAQAVFAQLKEGIWRKRREGGGGGTRVSSMLVRAVAAVKGITEEEARDFVASLDPEKRKLLRYHPKVAAELARLQAEKKGIEVEV